MNKYEMNEHEDIEWAEREMNMHTSCSRCPRVLFAKASKQSGICKTCREIPTVLSEKSLITMERLDDYHKLVTSNPHNR